MCDRGRVDLALAPGRYAVVAAGLPLTLGDIPLTVQP